MKLKVGELLECDQLDELLIEHLDEVGKISVRVPILDYYLLDENLEILSIEKIGERKFAYRLSSSSSIESFSMDVGTRLQGRKGRKVDPLELKRKIEEWTRDAMLRASLCEHGNLERDVMRFLKSYDDVILAPDTNILLDCVTTSILLPKIEQKIGEELKGCPNWILIAIPKLVMYEVERKAIRKFSMSEFPERAGWPKYDGRIGQRALQEVLELDTNIDYRGVSIMTIGEIPSTFDSFKNDQTRLDSEIRYQVRDFISRISFHKGIFFITQDRVNAMMARAEGLQSLFLQKPEYNKLTKESLRNENVTRVIYETAVTYGEIRINGLGGFSIFWPGKHVLDWEKSRIAVTKIF